MEDIRNIFDILDEYQEKNIIKIINYFDDISSSIEVWLDEDKKETNIALQKIEEARFWSIKSIMHK